MSETSHEHKRTGCAQCERDATVKRLRERADKYADAVHGEIIASSCEAWRLVAKELRLNADAIERGEHVK